MLDRFARFGVVPETRGIICIAFSILDDLPICINTENVKKWILGNMIESKSVQIARNVIEIVFTPPTPKALREVVAVAWQGPFSFKKHRTPLRNKNKV